MNFCLLWSIFFWSNSLMMGLFSMSPQAQRQKDKDNRPMGEIPSGVPSVAGNNSRQASGTSGKLSSSYPPIFNACPGESWEQYILEECDFLCGIRREVTSC